MHEGKAIQEYINLTGNKACWFSITSLWFSWMFPRWTHICKRHCIQQCGVLEIKCPWKYRNHTIAEIMKEEVENKKTNNFYTKPWWDFK